MMNDLSTILISFGSAVIASLLTHLSARHLRNLDFKREARKFLVEKRINAYDKIERIIISLDEKKIIYNSENQIEYHGHSIFVFEPGKVSHCKNVLNQFKGYSYLRLWMSNEMSEVLTEIFQELRSIDSFFITKSERPNSITVLSGEKHLRLRDLISEAKIIFYKDCTSIMYIDEFVKKKSVDF